MAWLFLQENVQVQYLQKIRLDLNIFGAGWIFRTKCDFLQVLDLHIFLQKQPGHWGRGCLHFHLLASMFYLGGAEYTIRED